MFGLWSPGTSARVGGAHGGPVHSVSGRVLLRVRDFPGVRVPVSRSSLRASVLPLLCVFVLFIDVFVLPPRLHVLVVPPVSAPPMLPTFPMSSANQ